MWERERRNQKNAYQFLSLSLEDPLVGSKRGLLQAKIGPVDGQSLPRLSCRVQAEPVERMKNILIGEKKSRILNRGEVTFTIA